MLLARRRSKLPADTSCFRWVDRELADVTVDLWGDVATLTVFTPEVDAQATTLAVALTEAAPLRAVYLKRRLRPLPHATPEASHSAPLEPLCGSPVDSVDVAEAGLRFRVHPSLGASPGLFLDSRAARQWVRNHASGLRVLNAFAYSCGFGVSAMVGGATSVANVDCAQPALALGKTNYDCNGLPFPDGTFIRGEVTDWLRRFQRRGTRFDLVVCDPPAYASAGRVRWRAATDYAQLVESAAAVLAPGGQLLAMCNVVGMDEVHFDRLVRQGLKRQTVRRIERFGADPLDFPNSRNLKCLVYELRASSGTPAPPSSPGATSRTTMSSQGGGSKG